MNPLAGRNRRRRLVQVNQGSWPSNSTGAGTRYCGGIADLGREGRVLRYRSCGRSGLLIRVLRADL